MLKYRIERYENPHASVWDEMMLDGEVLMDLLEKDAAAVIPAIVYNPQFNAGARGMAQKLAELMKSKYKLAKPVPLIMVNTTANVTAGGNPFVFEEVPVSFMV